MTTTTTSELRPKRISPKEAMLLTDDGKRAYFQGVRLGHPRINQTLETMATLSAPTSGKSIILLIGPTGVGKSTLVSALGERLMESMMDEIERDPGIVPVAKMVVPASGERNFAWRMFYQALGDALDEPLMGRKLETRIGGGRTTVWQAGSRSSVSAMRTAVEKAMANRRTRMLVIDEAVPILRAGKDKLENHMDAIKTLSDNGATLVLVGSYDLHRLASLEAQVARRTAIVQFERYHLGEEDDERDFRKMVGNLQAHMPLESMPDLREIARDLQVASLGCVGILKGILSTVLECALRNKGQWSDDYLERALPSREAHATILRETLRGEDMVRESTIGTGSFKSLMAQTEAMTTLIKAEMGARSVKESA